jgi:hypothetical protein
MVFLTSVSILDTGFLSTTTRSSQLSTSNRSNNGTQLELKAVTMEITSSSNLDKTVPPASYTGSQHAVVSVNPRQFSMEIDVDSNNTDTSNRYGINDASLIPELLRMPETVGFKAVFYPVDKTATGLTLSRDSQLVFRAGTADASTVAQGDLNLTLWSGSGTAGSKTLKDVKYLAVRFDSCRIIQTTTNMMKVSLAGVVTT